MLRYSKLFRGPSTNSTQLTRLECSSLYHDDLENESAKFVSHNLLQTERVRLPHGILHHIGKLAI